jgi:hypothetical protein
MAEDRQARMTDVTDATPANFPASLFCGEDGHLYLTVGTGNSRPIIRVEPNALKEVGRFGSTSSGLTNTTTRFVASRWMGMVSAYGPRAASTSCSPARRSTTSACCAPTPWPMSGVPGRR